MKCESINGNLSDQAVCIFAQNRPEFPTPEEYIIRISGNNPTPSSINGREEGVRVTIGAGPYSLQEDVGNVNTNDIAELLGLNVIGSSITATGDCNIRDGSATIVGLMPSSSRDQNCRIINTIVFNGGTVPGTDSQAPET